MRRNNLSIRNRAINVALGAFIIVGVGIPSQGLAIPYFARKYKTTCARCHVGFPKLNQFGRNFQLHGYQQPGEKNVGTIPTPEDPNLSLLEQLPIAIFIENRFELDKTVGKTDTPTNIGSPSAFHLLAGGTLAPDIGMFAELATDDSSSDNAATTGKVMVTFNHLGGRNIHFQVGKLDLMEHGVTEHNLFTRAGLAVLDMTVGNTEFNIGTENRGFRVYGMVGSPLTPELFHSSKMKTGGKTPTTLGAPAEAADAMHGPKLGVRQGKDELEEADPMDQYKGFLWEVGVYQGMEGPTQQGQSSAKDIGGRLNAYFNNDSFLGVFGYSGQSIVGGDPTVSNKHSFTGADFSVELGKPFEKSPGVMQKPFNFLGGYYSGKDNNPLGDGTKVNWNGFFGEGDYVIGSNRIFLVRYDKVNSTDLPELERHTLTAHLSQYIRTNFQVGLEYTHDLTQAKQHLLGILFNFAF